MNMIRIGGTMIYESDLFYDLCDELGIMVWQDFMFANMDYPVQDEAFLASIRAEARQFLERTQLNPSLVVACGNSEVEQQVAMLGLPAEQWSNEFFREELPRLCREYRNDVIYWQASPHGGTLPFHTDKGVSHYYGVGAYQRPLNDARRAGVRFTSECLGFSHIPETAAVERLLGEGEAPAVHPKWKQRVPRDQGAGWDFEDVRDHYVEALFGVKPQTVRYADSDRYLALGRVATGEVVARTLGEWRRKDSPCQGALLWLLKDLWLGAGWGVIDASNDPKPAYYFVKRAMASQAVFFSDEGLNGLDIHVINERPEALEANLSVRFLRQGQIEVAAAQKDIHLPAHSSESLRAQTLFPYFIDMTYAYRFGPSGHDAALVSLINKATGELISEDWYFPEGLNASQQQDLGLEAVFVKAEDGTLALELSTKRHAQFVAIEAKGFTPQTNYFHVAPGTSYRIPLQDVTGTPSGYVSALNASRPVKISAKAPE